MIHLYSFVEILNFFETRQKLFNEPKRHCYFRNKYYFLKKHGWTPKKTQHFYVNYFRSLFFLKLQIEFLKLIS